MRAITPPGLALDILRRELTMTVEASMLAWFRGPTCM